MKKCAIINDFAGLGRCSLVAGISTLSAMGVQPCPIPTAILSSQTDGFKDYTYFDFTENMQDYINHWKKLNIKFDSIYTGYLGSVKQIEIVKNFINYYKAGTIVLVDPVLGDDGKLYPDFNNENILVMKDLIKNADIITPNFTEFCFLTNYQYTENPKKIDYKQIEEKIKALKIDKVIITSLPGSKVKTLVYENGKITILSNTIVGKSFPGTGDIFTSILIGGITTGLSLKKATKQAIDFVYKSLKNSSLSEPIEFGVSYEKILKKYKFK